MIAPATQDRADVITRQILQIVSAVLRDWLHDRPVSLADARAAVATLLRDELADVERQALADTRRSDP